MKNIVLILLALILPGIASYFVVQRVFFPPLAYVIEGPTMADISADSPSALMPAEEAGAEAPIGRNGAPADAAPGMGDAAGRPARNANNRPTGNTNNRPVGNTANAGNQAGRPSSTEQRGSFSLMRLFTSIGRLEQDGTATLSVAQAKSILALMNPLRKQAKLTSAQANSINSKLSALLTKAQLAEIEQLSSARSNGGAGGPRNSGNPGAGNNPPGERGNRPAPPAGLEDMNPFNSNNDNPMTQRMDDVFSLLEKKAAQ